MIRGTTPTHVFQNIPLISTDIKSIQVNYQQGGRVILERTKDSMTITDDEETQTCLIELTLTQEETLLFKQGQASVQLRILLNNGTALAAKEIKLQVGRIVKNGIIE